MDRTGDEASVIVSLFIESTDLTTEQMSERIGLTSGKSWQKGDSRGRTGKTFATNSWKLESRAEVEDKPLLVGETLNRCLEQVLHRISENAARFKDTAYGQIAGLLIGISCGETPPIIFDAKIVEAIDALGIGLEIDLTIR